MDFVLGSELIYADNSDTLKIKSSAYVQQTIRLIPEERLYSSFSKLHERHTENQLHENENWLTFLNDLLKKAWFHYSCEEFLCTMSVRYNNCIIYKEKRGLS